jgi:hypothetical protein
MRKKEMKSKERKRERKKQCKEKKELTKSRRIEGKKR